MVQAVLDGKLIRNIENAQYLEHLYLTLLTFSSMLQALVDQYHKEGIASRISVLTTKSCTQKFVSFLSIPVSARVPHSDPLCVSYVFTGRSRLLVITQAKRANPTTTPQQP